MAAVTARRDEIARIIDPEAWAISDGSATGTQIAASLDALERWRVASLAKADAILATDGRRHEMAALITEACCFLVKKERPEPGSPTYDIISRLTDALIATGVGDIPAATDGREIVKELVEALGEACDGLDVAIKAMVSVDVFVNSKEQIKQPEGRDWWIAQVVSVRLAAQERTAHAKAKDWLEGR